MKKFAIYSAGSNSRGQLAHDSTTDSHFFNPCLFSDPASQLQGSTQVCCIAAGANHTLVLLLRADGMTEIRGCGDGSKGQLGEVYRRDHGFSSRLRPIMLEQAANHDVKLIAASWETSFVVLSHKSRGDILLSMGANDFGDLGVLGSQHTQSVSQTSNIVNFGHLFSCEAFSHNIQIVELKAGPHHIVAKIVGRLADGRTEELVAGWGASRYGQLGAISSSKPARFLPSPHAVPINDVLSFALGNQHSVFLQPSGQVCGFGSSRKDQLANLSSLSDVQAIAATWHGTYLVAKRTEGWTMFATGSNSNGQLARNPSDALCSKPSEVRFPEDVKTQHFKFMSLACGSEHVLVLLQRASLDVPEVWAWGWNEHGNLGLGHTQDVTSPTRVWPPFDSSLDARLVGRAVGIWAGCGTSWIVVETD